MAGYKVPKNKKMSITKNLNKYEQPKYVYIPLIVRNDDNITVLVKKGDYVYKGTVIGKTKDKDFMPIHSSISGFVIDIVEKTYITNKKVKCIKIENDFKNDIENAIDKKNNLSEYSKSEFIELIRNCGIVGLGGAGFPTFLKYNSDKKIKTLIINAVECEPYITADYMTVTTCIEEILEAIDAVMEINEIDSCFIAIKDYNIKLKQIISSYIGTYPKIKIREVKNIYPMGWERFLVREIKKVSYDKIPIEKGIVVNNISTMYAIYEALKFQLPLTERIVTFTGTMFKNPQNVSVKIGTEVSEVINYIGDLKRYNDILFIAGGPMMGEAISDDDLIISNNVHCILVLKDEELYDNNPCIRCGKCNDVCPAKISPVLIKDHITDVDKLCELNPNKCIECGLCSYICPSGIRVRNFVVRAKEKVNKGD